MAKGFWSYARNDDAHTDNQITELRNRVAGEIALHLGRDIDMFQDIYDLRTGDDWEAALRGNLSAASFLIPVLTPRYFERPWCREEVMTFLRLTSEAGIQPMIFPIYFITDRKGERGASDEVRDALSRYQRFDFRDYRFEKVEQARRKMLHDFAVDVADRIEGEDPPYAEVQAEKDPNSQPSFQEKPKTPYVRSEPEIPTLVVDPWPNRGDHTTIMAAINAASPGDRILIRPGTYPENVVLEKELELIGEGEPGELRIEVSSVNALRCTAAVAKIANITFERLSEDGQNTAVLVTAGRAEFQNCRFRSESISGVEVKGASSQPRFTDCKFKGSKESGARAIENAKPIFENCEFLGNGLHGAEVTTSANPVFRNCKFHGNTQAGASSAENGRGIFADCAFSENGFHGASVNAGADPVFQRCHFNNNTQAGARVSENGRGRLENCNLLGNGYYGIAVKEEGIPHVTVCVIADNKYAGIRTEDATGGGVFERNVFRSNGGGAWNLAEGSEANVTRIDNREE